MTDVAPISPAELLRTILVTDLDPALVPGGITIGSVGDDQINAGCISIMDAGEPGKELYTRLVRAREQVRCLAPTLEHVDRLARTVYTTLDQHPRRLVNQASTGYAWLVHTMNVSAGPSFHRDSEENWEGLMFVVMLLALDPASTGA